MPEFWRTEGDKMLNHRSGGFLPAFENWSGLGLLGGFAVLLLQGPTLVSASHHDGEPVVLQCGRVMSMTSDQVLRDTAIRIENGLIHSIGQSISTRGARIIDLSDHTCLPGLIDLHAHILINPTSMTSNEMTRPSAERALDGLKNAQTMLHAGFTTLRDPGDFDVFFATVAVKKAFAKGQFIGPELFVAPHLLGPTGGHGDLNELQPEFSVRTPTRTADGPDEIRKVIREEIKYGADWIKVMATGGVMSAGDDPNQTAYTEEELQAAVDETHRHGRKITVHAIGTEGIKSALRAGVDSIEHGILIDEEGIRMAKQRGTWLIPTLFVLDYIIEEGDALGYPRESIDKAIALQGKRDQNIRRAFEAGVPIAFGSDTIFPHHLAAKEFARMVGLGLSPYRAIEAATINAARVLGIENRVGTLEEGKAADIIAVPGNPLTRIELLENVPFVMKRGMVITAPHRDESAQVAALARDAWQHLLAQSPGLQNRQGMLVTEIPDLSEEKAGENVAFARSMLERLDEIPIEALSHDDTLTLEALRWDNEMAVGGEKFFWLQFPITPYRAGQVIAGLHQVLGDHPFAEPDHTANYLGLLEEYAAMLDQWTAHTRGQAERGIRVSKHALPGIVRLLDVMRDGAARAALSVNTERLEAVARRERRKFATVVDQVISGRVEPAYEALLALLTSENYQSNAPDTVGLAQYPAGEAYYRFLVKAHTTMDVTPEELHALGEQRVAALEAEMAKIRDELGFEGTREEFHDMLRTDPRFLATTPGDVEARYMEYIARIEPRVLEYFSTRPKAAYGVKRLDLAQEASMTFGYYQQPTPAESVGYYRYNGSKLKDRSLVWAGPLIYHELIPGHHFHIASQNENESLPVYRRENVSYGAFTEGWGNYAAKLAVEMGLMNDPYDRYGWALFDMFISVRLVVDTGMNLMGWSLDEGRRYMRDHLFQSETEIVSESLRYSTDLNAQALCYKAGLEKLLALRDRARELAGGDLDIRDFHDAALGSGALPMRVLEDHIEWFFSTENVRPTRDSSSTAGKHSHDLKSERTASRGEQE